MRALLAFVYLSSCHLALAQGTLAQEPDGELPAPGLLASFQDELGNRCQRVDEQVSFVWRHGSPDPRIGTGKFTANWKGQVLLRTSGEYRFQAFLQGKLTAKLDGRIVLDGTSDKAGWLSGAPAVFRAGFRDLEIEFVKSSQQAQLLLGWSGPGFALEPVNYSVLFHNVATTEHNAATTGPGSFDRGRQLVKALRCTTCHDIPTAVPALHGPNLDAVRGNLESAWIVDRLTKPDAEPVEDRQMPHFNLTLDEARAITAFLSANSKPAPNTTRDEATALKKSPEESFELKRQKSSGKSNTSSSAAKKKNSKEKEKHQPSAQGGERLFATLGCLACHRIGDMGSRDLFGGGQLSRVAEKRTPGFFARWLRDPKAINPHHRMPRFDLSTEELIDLELFFATQTSPTFSRPAVSSDPGSDRQLVELGKKLVAEHRCAACHVLPNVGVAQGTETATASRIALSASPNWKRSCIDEQADAEQSANNRPLYKLSADDHATIKDYLRVSGSIKRPALPSVTGNDLLESNNCLACHPRGLGRGISDTANAVANKFASSVEHVATLIPPSLNSIGDKLNDEALQRAVLQSNPPLRPWLQVRMPKYPFDEKATESLTGLLIDADRFPADKPERSERLDEQQLRSTGARLVTSDGFGCTSCHAVNDVAAGTSPINARGPNLGGLGQRIRLEWFKRWVSNPLRIVPRIEMPSITSPVPGVLAGNLNRQIDAVWDALNLDGFKPPVPNPVRVVRRLGLPDVHERAAFLTDVIKLNETQWLKPMLVGLRNRHNMLFNLEEFRLDGWWIGDVARQRTAGKAWYWEAAGDNLWNPDSDGTDVQLIGLKDANPLEITPEYVGQFRSELDQWRHVDRGIEAVHRLHFTIDPADPRQLTVVNVTQTITELPSTKDQRSGWRRTLRFTHVPTSLRIRVRISPDPRHTASTISSDRRTTILAGVGDKRIHFVSASTPALFEPRGTVVGTPDDNGAFELTLDYTTNLPIDSFPNVPDSKPPEIFAMPLHVVPGFKATQLSLPSEIMPTGFAWQPDGSMIVTSLRGNVWRAKDADRDGLFDAASPISDELAAPYGAAATADYVDVINKYGLLRLWDDDRDGYCERTETVASGWGHTADYHDWALGLPRTNDGGYWVAIPCQQDERTAAAAYLRGKVVKLVPREPVRENPHRFNVETYSGGHRFPMGIAVDRSGEAFVTDNQGNYNPFNELNHLKLGARYGFINANEKSPGFEPPLTRPAIDIPHPWTRSVNGICFLNSSESTSGPAFGPFEGHMIGCEYDTQRLVRMTLDRVGDTFQGTAYPFSYDVPSSGPPLLGPVSCAVSPTNQLMIGNLRDSGWGAGQNTGNVVQLQFEPESLPAGIAEVRAQRSGFRIAFTKPVSIEKARDRSKYAISSYTRTSTPQYGGDDQQRSNESVSDVQVASDNLSVFVEIGQLEPGFVYEIHVDNLTLDNAEFFPADAYATIRVIP